MLRKFTALSLIAGTALLAACQMQPHQGHVHGGPGKMEPRPLIGQPAASEFRHAAVSRARIRNLRAEVVGQIRYLDRHLGRDRAHILDLQDSLLVTISGQGAFVGRTDRLTPAGVDQVERIAASLLAFPHTRLSVIGHVEGSQSSRSDKILSDRRAVMVKSVLQRSGVDACRIGVLGQGSGDPVAPPLTGRQDQFNSRIEVMIMPRQDGACT